MINIALLGFGTVGKGTYEILEKRKSQIKSVVSDEIVVKKILKRNLDFKTNIDKNLFTTNYEEILNDESISVVVELTGDENFAYDSIKKAFEKKKSVVTANKAVVSLYFEELNELAKKNNVKFLYEASVGGSIPIITPLRSQKIFNDIQKVRGILNGTSNFLLSSMYNDDRDYDEVLKEAQDIGFAEADPTSDVSGLDSLRKLRILSTIAFNGSVKNENILHYGISTVLKTDMVYLKSLGKKIKLIAEASLCENEFSAVVEPVILNDKDKLFNIEGSDNSVEIFGENYTSLIFTGQGAGKLPTGNAVCQDIVDVVLSNIINVDLSKNLVVNNKNLKGRYYVRIRKDKTFCAPLTKTAKVIGEYKIIRTKEMYREELIKILEKFSREDYFFARFDE